VDVRVCLLASKFKEVMLGLHPYIEMLDVVNLPLLRSPKSCHKPKLCVPRLLRRKHRSRRISGVPKSKGHNVLLNDK
jgi:hypothetical protein